MSNRVEREFRDVRSGQPGLREPRGEERVVAGVEPAEDLPRGGLVVEGDVVRHAHHEEALPRQELQQVAVGDLGDGADEGSAEELDDREWAAAPRGRKDEARVLPQVRPHHRRRRPGSGDPEHGQRAVGAEGRAAGEASRRFGAAAAGRELPGFCWRGGRCGAEEVSSRRRRRRHDKSR